MTPDSPPRGILPLAPRTFLLASGPDAQRFLNGQLTNDIRLASETSCVYSAVLNAKGQLDAVCRVWMIGSAYLLEAPGDLRDSLLPRLDRYLIADEVELEDVSDGWHLYHAMGIVAEELPSGVHAAPVRRFGADGIDLLSDKPLELGLPALDAGEAEALRIAAGVPAWRHELTPGLLPPEAGLDQTAISYDKGCYLGQEVISRMKRAGKTNRHLVKLTVPADTAAGTALLVDDTEAGIITSISPIPSNNHQAAALGFRSRKFETTATFQLANHPGQAKVT